MLRPNQLVVERFGVHKIRQVEHAIPHNTVTVRMTQQMTGNWATRNLRWDEQVTTEEPFEVAIGDTGKITVELALVAGERGRPLYKYQVSDSAEGISFASAGLQLAPKQKPDNAKAAQTLLSELQASSEAWAAGHALEADDFPEDVNRWSANHGAEIALAQVELAGGLGGWAMTTVFFGERWDAPIVDNAEQVETPVFVPCYECGRL